jgi:hypothetical protein
MAIHEPDAHIRYVILNRYSEENIYFLNGEGFSA